MYAKNINTCTGDLDGICQKNGKFYKQAWKYFRELGREEEVLTLNQKTGAPEWQKPMAHIAENYAGDLYEIRLETGDKILVTPSQRVYGAMENKSSAVGIIMVPESQKNNLSFVMVNLEQENKTFKNVNSPFPGKVVPERLVVLGIQKNLAYLALKNFSENGVLFAGLIDFPLAGGLDFGAVHANHSKMSETDLSFIDGSLLAFSNSATNSFFRGSSSTGCQSILSQNSQSSSVNLPVCLYLSDMSRFISLITALAMNSESKATPSFDADSLISFTYNNIVREKYLNASLEPIASVYGRLTQNPNQSYYFLSEGGAPVKVSSITKVPYTGTVYDVDVENDVILVKRCNEEAMKTTGGTGCAGTAVFSGNQNPGTEVQIPYWIENYTTGVNATVWLKTNLTTGNNTVYMYYGNPGATYNNSLGGNNTFDAFDDFEGGTVGSLPSGWTNSGVTGYTAVGTVQVSADVALSGTKSVKEVSSAQHSALTKNGYAFTNGIIEVDYRTPNKASTGRPGIVYRYVDAGNFYNSLGTTEGNGWYHRKSMNTDLTTGTSFTFQSNFWHHLKVAANGSSLNVSIDGTALTATDTSYTTGSIGMVLGYSDTAYYDNFRVRKYASPEPSVLSIGTEQNAPVTNTTGAYSFTYIPNASITSVTTVSLTLNATDSDGINGTVTNSSAIKVYPPIQTNVTTNQSWYDVGATINATATVFYSNSLDNSEAQVQFVVLKDGYRYPSNVTVNTSAWLPTSGSTVSYQYTFNESGKYYVTVTAKNPVVNSAITVSAASAYTAGRLNTTINLNDSIIYSNENALVYGSVYDWLNSSWAHNITTVTLTNQSGTFSNSTPLTNLTGDYNSTYTPPQVTSIQTYTLSANATDTDTLSSSTVSTQIKVYPSISTIASKAWTDKQYYNKGENITFAAYLNQTAGGELRNAVVRAYNANFGTSYIGIAERNQAFWNGTYEGNYTTQAGDNYGNWTIDSRTEANWGTPLSNVSAYINPFSINSGAYSDITLFNARANFTQSEMAYIKVENLGSSAMNATVTIYDSMGTGVSAQNVSVLATGIAQVSYQLADGSIGVDKQYNAGFWRAVINATNGTQVSYRATGFYVIPDWWVENTLSSNYWEYRVKITLDNSRGIARNNVSVQINGSQLNASGANLSTLNVGSIRIVDAELNGTGANEVNGRSISYYTNASGALNPGDVISFSANISENSKKTYYIYYSATSIAPPSYASVFGPYFPASLDQREDSNLKIYGLVTSKGIYRFGETIYMNASIFSKNPGTTTANFYIYNNTGQEVNGAPPCNLRKTGVTDPNADRVYEANKALDSSCGGFGSWRVYVTADDGAGGTDSKSLNFTVDQLNILFGISQTTFDAGTTITISGNVSRASNGAVADYANVSISRDSTIIYSNITGSSGNFSYTYAENIPGTHTMAVNSNKTISGTPVTGQNSTPVTVNSKADVYIQSVDTNKDPNDNPTFLINVTKNYANVSETVNFDFQINDTNGPAGYTMPRATIIVPALGSNSTTADWDIRNVAPQNYTIGVKENITTWVAGGYIAGQNSTWFNRLNMTEALSAYAVNTFGNITLTGSVRYGGTGSQLYAEPVNITIAGPENYTYLVNNDSGLVGNWRFDEGAGTVALDRSGNMNNGTLTNMNTGIDNGSSGWASQGKFGNALMFNGNNSYVDAGNASSLQLINDLSIEAWIFPRDISTFQGIVTKATGSDGTTGYELSIFGGNIRFSIGNGTTRLGIFNRPLASANSWYHIVGTVSGTSINLYVNGVNTTPATFAGTRQNPARNLLIGDYATDALAYFNGTIDEVRIYNRSLSADEIYQHYIASQGNYNKTFNVGTHGNYTVSVVSAGQQYKGYNISNFTVNYTANLTIGTDVTSMMANRNLAINATTKNNDNASISGVSTNISMLNSSGDAIKSLANFTNSFTALQNKTNQTSWSTAGVSEGTYYIRARSYYGGLLVGEVNRTLTITNYSANLTIALNVSAIKANQVLGINVTTANGDSVPTSGLQTNITLLDSNANLLQSLMNISQDYSALENKTNSTSWATTTTAPGTYYIRARAYLGGQQAGDTNQSFQINETRNITGSISANASLYGMNSYAGISAQINRTGNVLINGTADIYLIAYNGTRYEAELNNSGSWTTANLTLTGILSQSIQARWNTQNFHNGTYYPYLEFNYTDEYGNNMSIKANTTITISPTWSATAAYKFPAKLQYNWTDTFANVTVIINNTGNTEICDEADECEIYIQSAANTSSETHLFTTTSSGHATGWTVVGGFTNPINISTPQEFTAFKANFQFNQAPVWGADNHTFNMTFHYDGTRSLDNQTLKIEVLPVLGNITLEDLTAASNVWYNHFPANTNILFDAKWKQAGGNMNFTVNERLNLTKDPDPAPFRTLQQQISLPPSGTFTNYNLLWNTGQQAPGTYYAYYYIIRLDNTSVPFVKNSDSTMLQYYSATFYIDATNDTRIISIAVDRNSNYSTNENVVINGSIWRFGNADFTGNLNINITGPAGTVALGSCNRAVNINSTVNASFSCTWNTSTYQAGTYNASAAVTWGTNNITSNWTLFNISTVKNASVALSTDSSTYSINSNMTSGINITNAGNANLTGDLNLQLLGPEAKTIYSSSSLNISVLSNATMSIPWNITNTLAGDYILNATYRYYNENGTLSAATATKAITIAANTSATAQVSVNKATFGAHENANITFNITTSGNVQYSALNYLVQINNSVGTVASSSWASVARNETRQASVLWDTAAWTAGDYRADVTITNASGSPQWTASTVFNISEVKVAGIIGLNVSKPLPFDHYASGDTVGITGGIVTALGNKNFSGNLTIQFVNKAGGALYSTTACNDRTTPYAITGCLSSVSTVGWPVAARIIMNVSFAYNNGSNQLAVNSTEFQIGTTSVNVTATGASGSAPKHDFFRSDYVVIRLNITNTTGGGVANIRSGNVTSALLNGLDITSAARGNWTDVGGGAYYFNLGQLSLGTYTVAVTVQDPFEGTSGTGTWVFVVSEHWVEFTVSSNALNPVSSTANKYGASDLAGSTATALMPHGSFNNITTASNSITVNQWLKDNSIYFVFTKGAWSNLQDRVAMMNSGELQTYTNPSFGFPITKNYRISVGLDYSLKGINLLGDMQLYPGMYSFVIRNEGAQNGKTVVSVNRK